MKSLFSLKEWMAHGVLAAAQVIQLDGDLRAVR